MAELFVQNPAGISLVGGLFFGAYWLLRRPGTVPWPQALLWPALAWTLWAAWEALIVLFSPEADIRVDLLVIVPVVLIVTVVGLVLLFFPRKRQTPS